MTLYELMSYIADKRVTDYRKADEYIISALNIRCRECPFRKECAGDLGHPEKTCEQFIAEHIDEMN